MIKYGNEVNAAGFTSPMELRFTCREASLPYSWSEDASYSERGDFDLSGLTIDQSSGIVRGTLFNSSSGKTLKFKVIVKDSTGATALFGPVYTITVK